MSRENLSGQVSLSQEQKEIIARYAQKFNDWKKTDDGKQTVTLHRDHGKYFKERLSDNNLPRMTEHEFIELYKELWASNMWGNKDWYVRNKLINPNGLEKIKHELSKLLYSSEDFTYRYNNFKKNISGFGVSSLSEILHLLFPEKFCLWDDKPKTVLPFLKLNILPERFFKYQISTGEEYYQCVQALSSIRSEEAEVYGIKDFIDLDILFWYIYKDLIPRESKLTKISDEKEDVMKVPRVVIDSH